MRRAWRGDLQRKGYAGRTIGIKLRFDDFRTVTRDLTLDRPTADAAAIRRAAGACLKRVPLDRKLRLLGVRVTGLDFCPCSLQAAEASAQAELPLAGTARLTQDAAALQGAARVRALGPRR
ncbi:MAG: hypothetical protein MZW92_49380 [Comamonadaceae bacterium]|nr:hypothetical protein [Comamonadaceae bacterium]